MPQASKIVYQEIQADNLDLCRGLCNALMEHQASMGRLHPEILRAMNFDNRLKPSFENAEEKQLIVALDGQTPVGYIFSSADSVTETAKAARPSWAQGLPGIHHTGLYPEWLPVPNKVGCLNNLYILPEYRGRHIAADLCAQSMNWLHGVPGIQYIFVYISNGNENVIDFYQHLGFQFSHEVFDGFIHAYFQKA